MKVDGGSDDEALDDAIHLELIYTTYMSQVKWSFVFQRWVNQ